MSPNWCGYSRTVEKLDSSIIFQPFSLSSEMQIILFGSGVLQLECIIPPLRPQGTSNPSPLANSYSLVFQSEEKGEIKLVAAVK